MRSMFHARAGRAAAVTSVLLVAAIVPWAASCATTQEDTSQAPEQEASTLPPGPDAGVDLDASPEAGCDAGSAECVTRALTCAEAPWCPTPTAVSSLYALTSVWGSSKNDVWAVGSGGTIIHFDGTTWVTTPTNLKNTFHAVTGSSATDVWALSATDVLLHSSGFAGGTATWQRLSAAANDYESMPVYAAWGTPAGDLRVGGRSFTLYEPNGDFGPGNQLAKKKLADGGIAWTGTTGTATVNGIWGSSAEDLWVVADNSPAVSWQLGLTLHGTRAPSGDAGDAGNAGGLVWQSVESQSSVVLAAVWGSSATDVWAVGDKGTIRHLASDASHWDPVESKTTDRLRAIWGTGADDIWAVGDTGTILHYDGTSWTPSPAAFPVGRKPNLYGVWGSERNDVWIVGDGIALHYTGGGK